MSTSDDYTQSSASFAVEGNTLSGDTFGVQSFSGASFDELTINAASQNVNKLVSDLIRLQNSSRLNSESAAAGNANGANSGVAVASVNKNNSTYSYAIPQLPNQILVHGGKPHSQHSQAQPVQNHHQINHHHIAHLQAPQVQPPTQNFSSQVSLSAIEEAILRSSVPIDINETEEINVQGQRGIWANKAEVVNWRGMVPIQQYAINEDSNPEVLTKKTLQNLIYIQELAVRYLRPPTPPPAGDIVITQENDTHAPLAPPIIIRQQPPRPVTPEPLVIREAPPPPPVQVGRKVITISGKRIPPPPRKVVIERLAPLPNKPQAVLIERWLPYAQTKRRVIFQRPVQQEPVIVKPRNVIIQWEAPQVQVKREIKYLGVIRANPAEYVARYGPVLKTARDMPQFVHDIRPPPGLVLAAEQTYNPVHELVGDVHALKYIDLEREGLSQYRDQLYRLVGGELVGSGATNHNRNEIIQTVQSTSMSSASSTASSSAANDALIEEIFNLINRNHNGRLNVEDAEKILLRLNSRFGRRYGEDEVVAFFRTLDVNSDGSIDLQEFKRAFLHLTFE